MNYKVYQGSELKQTLTSKTAVMNGLQPNKTYEFGVQPNNGKRDGTKVTKSVTTRGIRFNIPKTLTVGSTVTLRYEEYPLGIVPIGNEPSGYFGGGNKQNLSAKVISTANGSSVVEVAGNVIEVGNKNLIQMENTTAGYVDGNTGVIDSADYTLERVTDFIEVEPNQTYWMQDKVNLVSGQYPWFCVGIYDVDKAFISRPSFYGSNATDNVTVFNTLKIVMPNKAKYVRVSSSTYGNSIDKFEFGDVATPYASFVDCDTLTAQPDGTYALFSEYKALYY